MHRLFYPDPITVNQEIHLDGNPDHYLQHVLRMALHEKIILFNDTGYEFLAEIIQLQKKKTVLKIVEANWVAKKTEYSIHLAQGIAKSQKMDWIVQKAVELGISELTPLLLDYSQIRHEKTVLEKKRQHWQQIAIAASEQCGNVFVPAIHPVQFLPDFLQSQKTATMIILDPKSQKQLDAALVASSQLLLLIGAEGGFSAEEMRLLKNHQAHWISLGPRILRAETAPVVALSIIQYLKN